MNRRWISYQYAKTLVTSRTYRAVRHGFLWPILVDGGRWNLGYVIDCGFYLEYVGG